MYIRVVRIQIIPSACTYDTYVSLPTHGMHQQAKRFEGELALRLSNAIRRGVCVCVCVVCCVCVCVHEFANMVGFNFVQANAFNRFTGSRC